ncbi:flagellar motor switch protein FliM [Planococcus maritimus]|uniref:flagellar motor switch protein FliM n=1 Tax=Planococcus maritimus TaxID=192421 RepID=UPI00080F2913|nr:flagellar motor switch protein FliM [Planococcus maritimus]ANU15928.1 flagellar motor switch protein FliM [Planococcus maritimus]
MEPNFSEKDAEDLSNKNIHTYDFKKALRFSQDQIRTLSRIHENFARLLTSYFSAQLRTYVQITTEKVEQVAYTDFLQQIEKKSILGVFEAQPLTGSMVMKFSPEVAYVMFDRLLGGQGNVVQRSSDLTEIEISVINRIFNQSLGCFQEAWTSVIELSAELKEVEVNPQFLPMASPNETVIIVNLVAKIGDTEGKIQLCLPHLVLEHVLPKLSARHWLASQKKAIEHEEVEALEKRLHGTKMDIAAVLGEVTVDIKDFLDLKEGDVLRLNESVDAPVKLYVDQKQKFLAQPGTSKGRLAVQITGLCGEGEFYDEG